MPSDDLRRINSQIAKTAARLAEHPKNRDLGAKIVRLIRERDELEKGTPK